MFKTTLLAVALSLGPIVAANAAPLTVPATSGDTAIVTIGEGCGPGFWRNPNGACIPFHTPYGSYRGTGIECPPGWHIGSGRQRCWPNR